MVDASIAALGQGELLTIPALPDLADWEKFEAAHKALGPNLSSKAFSNSLWRQHPIALFLQSLIGAKSYYGVDGGGATCRQAGADDGQQW